MNELPQTAPLSSRLLVYLAAVARSERARNNGGPQIDRLATSAAALLERSATVASSKWRLATMATRSKQHARRPFAGGGFVHTHQGSFGHACETQDPQKCSHSHGLTSRLEVIQRPKPLRATSARAQGGSSPARTSGRSDTRVGGATHDHENRLCRLVIEFIPLESLRVRRVSKRPRDSQLSV